MLAAATPAVSREIGSYFKGIDAQTGKDRQGSPAHVMAHMVWNAAVAYATGNHAGSAALAAGGSEAVSPVLSGWLFNEKDPSKLDAAQKETIANISQLLGSGIGATTGNAGNALSDGLTARTVAEQNSMTRAGQGIAVPLLGALYCAMDKNCASVTDTFTGMLAEQSRQAQEEREKLFPLLSTQKDGEKKTQPQQTVSQSATGAPMPPDDEDEAKKSNQEKSSVDHIVKDKNGNFVGNVNKGATDNIRTVSHQEFQQIKNSLLKNAKEVGKYSNGRGTWYELPNGDRFGIRSSSRHGETLDFNTRGLPKDFKIHQK